MIKLENCIWYKANTVIHCKTEDEANEFCKLMDSYGLKWCNNQNYYNTRYDRYLEETCYYSFAGTYSDYDYYKSENYTILEWSEIKNMDKFTKSDLKTGMWVELRNGEKYMVVKDCETKFYGHQDFCLIYKDGFDIEENYDNNLIYKKSGYEHRDIVKILGSQYILRDTFTEPTNIIAEINQEENIMTIEEIEQRLGIKNLKIVGDK